MSAHVTYRLFYDGSLQGARPSWLAVWREGTDREVRAVGPSVATAAQGLVDALGALLDLGVEAHELENKPSNGGDPR